MNIITIKIPFEPVEDKPGYYWFNKRNYQIISKEVLKNIGEKKMLDLIGFDNITYEEMMLEKEGKEENKRKQEEKKFYEEFEREQELKWRN